MDFLWNDEVDTIDLCCLLPHGISITLENYDITNTLSDVKKVSFVKYSKKCEIKFKNKMFPESVGCFQIISLLQRMRRPRQLCIHSYKHQEL